MGTSPLISIVTPSFNQGQYIEETIVSVLGQQYPNLEYIIIDGGSTDKTPDIILRYADSISYYRSEPDKGQADAINQGMRLSSGDILCWLNSDDMYLPGTLLDIGQRFDGRIDQPHLLYGTSVLLSQENGNIWSTAHNTEPFNSERLTYWNYMVQPSSFWTRELWQRTGELNVNACYTMDWKWFLRASRFTTFEYVPKFYSIFRFHASHKTSTGGIKRRQEILDIVETYSSPYWKDLYRQIAQQYDRIIFVKKCLEFLRIPGRYKILPYFFPAIVWGAKQRRDIETALLMLT